MGLEQTFGVRSLTAAIRTFDTKAQDHFFTDLFMKGRKLYPEGRTAEWDEIRFSRTLAPIVALSAPAPKSPQVTRANRLSGMMQVKVSRDITWDRLFLDRHMGELKANAKATVMDELADMMLELGKTREFACAQVLKTGGLAIAGSGDTNVPGCNLAFTVDYGVNTYTKTNAWNNLATAIFSGEIPALQANAIAASGLPVENLIINDVTMTDLLQNTEVQKFGSAASLAISFLKENVQTQGPGFLNNIKVAGIEFDVNAYGFANAAGTFTKWLADQRAIALPGESYLPQVLALAEGRIAVPTNLWGSAGDLGIDQMTPGVTAWAKRTDDPVGITLYAAWFGLPIVLFPSAVTYCTLV